MSDHVHRIYDVSHEELGQDPENANLGTERGNALVGKSMDLYGPGRSILLDRNNVAIAGNKTLQAAVERGIPVTVVESRGETLVAVKRLDLILDDPEGMARGLALADNRTSEVNLDWDFDALQKMADDGVAQEFFFDNELEAMAVQVKSKQIMPDLVDDFVPLEGDDAWVKGDEPVQIGQTWMLGGISLTLGPTSRRHEAIIMIKAWERYTGRKAELSDVELF
jgi:hypothetical protein